MIEILSSSYAAAVYFQKHPLSLGKKVYVIGEAGICEELQLLGIPCLGGPSDVNKVLRPTAGVFLHHDKDVAAVVAGFDSGLNYYKIQYAQLCISENEGCRFIATNLDAVKHWTEEQEWAGGGAMVGAIQGCTGRSPIVVGKPSPLMIDYITGKYQLDRSRICMVGDRLDTDVLFGKNNGLTTILTLSGVTTTNRLFAPENRIRPDYFVENIGEFFK
jgi:phosphoglycolate/pyridoxal phosphate phosphatase family enzyme